jgi:nicotinamidase-related amidase
LDLILIAIMAQLLDLNPEETLFLVCDLQERIRPAIFGFDHVVNTVNKMFKFAGLLGIPVVLTTQNSKSLGPTDPAVDLNSLGLLHVATVDKTLFSMLTDEVHRIARERNIKYLVLMGIETHVCLLQTAIAALGAKLTPILLSDATSSCNPCEPPQARALLLSLGKYRRRHEHCNQHAP